MSRPTFWPPEDFRSLARLGELSATPIATGENACTAYQFKAMLDAGAATYIQPSVIKVGGITEWHKVALLAETYNLKIAAHSPYFGPGLLASAHLVAATPCAESMEYYYVNLEASVFQPPPKFEEGYISVPPGPGPGPGNRSGRASKIPRRFSVIHGVLTVGEAMALT
jgi:L-alanine-DL-glutamate epimerase-like enolase superfamily enzyme